MLPLALVALFALLAALGSHRSPTATWAYALVAICWLFIAWNILLDVYSFDESGVLTRRPLGVRVLRVAWSDVRRFEKRGFWRGAGAWLNDGRWLKLRGIALIDKNVDREVALLEYVRQQPPHAVGTGLS